LTYLSIDDLREEIENFLKEYNSDEYQYDIHHTKVIAKVIVNDMAHEYFRDQGVTSTFLFFVGEVKYIDFENEMAWKRSSDERYIDEELENKIREKFRNRKIKIFETKLPRNFDDVLKERDEILIKVTLSRDELRARDIRILAF